jgi:hypothetical protein
MILNFRGTSGSGKTTVVRGLMAKYPTVIPLGEFPEKKPDGYECRPDRKAFDPGDDPIADGPNLYVVGSYKNTCGGCDGIKTQDEACDRVRRYAALGDVLFEGLLISHIFARYQKLDQEMAQAHGHKTIWAFLDTPLELCLDRIRERRNARAAAKGVEPKPLNTKNTENKWNDARRSFQKAKTAGLDARWLDHTNPIEQSWGWLKG